MEQRYRFIDEYNKSEEDLAELCRKYEVSRKTGYKWIARYEEGGVKNLEDRSRAPQHHPNQVSARSEERIVQLRSEHPRWGPKKLWHWLQREEGGAEWPAISTIGAVLKRRGMVWARKPKRHASASQQPLSEAEQPNQVWCTDYKGWFRCGNGQACYPLTLTDSASRFLLRCQALRRADLKLSQPV
jgi:transposase